MSEIKKLLEEIKDNNNKTLKDHLNNILSRILLENPKNAYEIFEEFSLDIKINGFDPKKPKKYEETNHIRDNLNEVAPHLEKVAKLYQVKYLYLINYYNLRKPITLGTEDDP